MHREPPRYISYLLRLWWAGSEDGPSWRATLDNPHSGERQVFGNLAALFTFLEEQTHRSAPGQEETDED
ncbi:MAG: hypothetical protein IT329_18240 [Caldilineaceae bacterium]|nr:hypothetical protein [Caldilineaceae bacterium]